MRTGMVTLALALVIAAPAPASAREMRSDDVVLKAAQVLKADPAKAIALVNPVIASSEAMTPKADTNYFCARTPTDTIAGLFGSTLEKKSGVALSNSICVALFVKGFALVDLNRRAEAEPFLRRATELAPEDAHYLNEYAEWWKNEHQWQKSYDLFAAAESLATKQAGDERAEVHARSLRGMGFALIEMGRLDDAERRFRESQKFEPDSSAARNELTYIKEQRQKARGKPAT